MYYKLAVFLLIINIFILGTSVYYWQIYSKQLVYECNQEIQRVSSGRILLDYPNF